MKTSDEMKQLHGPPVEGIINPRTTHTSRRSKTLTARLLWIVILLVHSTCSAYYIVVALIYHAIPTTFVGDHMKANALVIDLRHAPVLVVLFGIFAALHFAFLLEMLVRSARRRALVFHSRTLKSHGVLTTPRSLQWIATDTAKVGTHNSTTDDSKTRSFGLESLRQAERVASRAWERSFGATGFFGVGGAHFALLFLVRETVETTLQSIQAYSLSKYVPRVWMNRSAVAIVVASSWSTPAIRRLVRRSPRLQLLACLLVDVLFDLASSIGTPVALGAPYFFAYDPVARTFSDDRWSDDAWVANLNSEFKQLFIQSWLDFGSSALIASALLYSIDDVKLLAAASMDSASALVIPSNTDNSNVKPSRRFEKTVHAGLVVWGFAILGLHFASIGSASDATDCLIRVRPWTASEATCIAMEIDCSKHDGMVGAAAEVEARWSDLDPQALRLLIFRHCPQLHMPVSINIFPSLTGLYIYSSTLLDWTASAALTKACHPNLRQITLIFVDMTAACDGSSSLPPGLLARDFPPTLGIFVAVGVALDRLPPDLHEIWPRGMTLLLIGVNIASVPDTLLRMEPMQVNLLHNNISRLPAAIFEIPALKWLDVSWNPLGELPENVEPSPSLLRLSLGNTNVSSLPKWAKSEAFLRRVQVQAAITPLCAQLGAAVDAESKALAAWICW